MDETAVRDYLLNSLAGVDMLAVAGDYYFYYEPDRSLPPDRRFPFATLVTSDAHDQASNLARPGVYRLNVGVSKETFHRLFASDAEHDFTALDRIMPHPVYGKMYWTCVLNPSAGTFEAVKPLLAEAHHKAKNTYENRSAQGGS